MANKLNKSFFQGNLVKDPDYRDFGNGNGCVCTLRLANSRKFTNNGKEHEETTFVDCQVYGKVASTCRQFLSKGSEVLIEGRLHLAEWQTKDGQQRQKLEMVAENVQFMSRGNSSNAHRPPSNDQYSKPQHRQVEPEYAPMSSPDEDIPF